MISKLCIQDRLIFTRFENEILEEPSLTRTYKETQTKLAPKKTPKPSRFNSESLSHLRPSARCAVSTWGARPQRGNVRALMKCGATSTTSRTADHKTGKNRIVEGFGYCDLSGLDLPFVASMAMSS